MQSLKFRHSDLKLDSRSFSSPFRALSTYTSHNLNHSEQQVIGPHCAKRLTEAKRGRDLSKVTQRARGSVEVWTPSFRFPASLPSWVPDSDPSRPGLGVGPHPCPGEEGRGRPDCLKMPRRQGRRCSRSRSSKASRWCCPGPSGRSQAAEGSALPSGRSHRRRLTCSPSRTRAAAAAAAGAAANRGLSHSPLPRMGRDRGRSLP